VTEVAVSFFKWSITCVELYKWYISRSGQYRFSYWD